MLKFFLSLRWSYVASTVALVLSILVGLKTLWPKRPKLRIVEIKDCSIIIARFGAWFWGEKVQFTLLVDNSGSQKCIITLVGLKLPDGKFAVFKPEKSTKLPLTISTDKPEEIKWCGLCREEEKLNDAYDVPKRPDMFPEQGSIKATILININTKKHPFKRVETFVISRPQKNLNF